jgi:hypothetical protein
MKISAVLLISILAFLTIQEAKAKEVTCSFSGLMQGNTIFPDGTPFFGSFTYSHPQNPDSNYIDKRYHFSKYNLTILGEAFTIPPAQEMLITPDGSFPIGEPIPVDQVNGSSWDGIGGSNFMTVGDGLIDFLSVSVANDHLLSYAPGLLKIWGPSFTLFDETGNIFSDTNLPDLSIVNGHFTSVSIQISYDVDAGTSNSQTGIMTSIIPEPSTYALLIISAAGAYLARRRHK